MPILVACESCRAQFKAPDGMAGKRCKCPKCGSALTVGQPTTQDTLPPPVMSAQMPAHRAVQIPLPTQPIAERNNDPLHRSFTIKISVANVLMVCVSLLIGYFIGREHTQYQSRREPRDTASSGVTSAIAAEELRKSDVQRPETVPAVVQEAEAPAPASASEPILDVGQAFVGKGFEVSVTEAKVERPSLRDLLGDKVRGNFQALTIKLQWVNTDDRKILRYQGGNLFGAGHFSLHDDVNNEIRGVNLGAGSISLGDLTGIEEIAPGATGAHVEIFSVPPPKTKFLILTMNLAALGADGSAKFKIPVEKIVGFAVQ